MRLADLSNTRMCSNDKQLQLAGWLGENCGAFREARERGSRGRRRHVVRVLLSRYWRSALTCAITSATYRMVPGGTAPRRLNVNGIKTTSAGDIVTGSRSPSYVLPTADGSSSCFTLSPSPSDSTSTAATSTRTLPCRAAVPPPPPPKPSWSTASRQRALKEDCRRENEQHAARHGHHTQSERSTTLEDGGLISTSQSAPVTTWDQSMPMLAEETTTDDVNEARATPGTSCSGSVVGGKLTMFFLVGIPVIGVVAAALAWFYSCRQVCSSTYNYVPDQ